MVTYNGYEVYPDKLRQRSAGFSDCGEALDAAAKALNDAVGDGSYLGNDKYGAEFRKQCGQLLDSIPTKFGDASAALHGIHGGLHQMANTYNGANDASVIEA